MTAATEPVPLDVLIPTCGRPDALAVTLSGLLGQTARGFRVLVADQTETRRRAGDEVGDTEIANSPAVRTVLALLRRRGHPVEVTRNLPRRGMAQQRAHLLARARSPYVLFLDDDVLLEPETVARLLVAIKALGCGFVGAAVQGLSHLDDERPEELATFEPWRGPVIPERIRKGDPAWERWRLHNAANLLHLQRRLRLAAGQWLAYRVCWVGGCVLYDRAALLAAGGFGFWRSLPPNHRGEDVVAQLRVMQRRGGAGVLPTGAYHLQLPTTLPDRRVDAYAAVLEAEDRAVPDRRGGVVGVGEVSPGVVSPAAGGR